MFKFYKVNNNFATYQKGSDRAWQIPRRQLLTCQITQI